MATESTEEHGKIKTKKFTSETYGKDLVEMA